MDDIVKLLRNASLDADCLHRIAAANAIERLRVELDALKAAPPIVPDGWQLVPVEPTKAMLDSSIYPQSYLPLGGSNEANRLRRRAQKIYAAMLAAAPKPGDQP